MSRGFLAVASVGTIITGLLVTGHHPHTGSAPAGSATPAPTASPTRASRAEPRLPLRVVKPAVAAGKARHDLTKRVARPATRSGYVLNWTALAQCESSGDWHANTGDGFYGGVQFDLQTWRSVGGHGLPSDASEAEQIARATVLFRERGRAPWPVCGRYL